LPIHHRLLSRVGKRPQLRRDCDKEPSIAPPVIQVGKRPQLRRDCDWVMAEDSHFAR